MRVSIVRGGGLAGLVITTAVDTSALAEQDATTLRDMVRAADLANLPSSTSAAMPDAQSYEISLESPQTNRTVVLTEHDLPAPVRSLITWIESVPGHERSTRPPG